MAEISQFRTETNYIKQRFIMHYKSVLILFLLYSQPVFCLTLKDIDSTIGSFDKVIGFFPPQVNDSIEKITWEKKLSTFIEEVNQTRKSLTEFQYNLKMGNLYYFAFNLDMDSGWTNSERYLLKAIELDPENAEAQIQLSCLYGNSCNPNDTAAFHRELKSVEMMQLLRKNGQDVKYPIINYNLSISGIFLHLQPLAYDAAYDYLKTVPKDSTAIRYKSLIESIKVKSSYLTAENKIKTYKNNSFDFQVSYSDALILYFEKTDTLKEHFAIFQTETPLTKTSFGPSIRNAISISCWDLKYTDANTKIDEIKKRLLGKNIKNRKVNLPAIISSQEFENDQGPPDGFKGILTFEKSNKFIYALMYVATGSTYEKNLPYYAEFEKNFKINSKK